MFGRLFNAGPEFAADGRRFDRLFDDNATFQLGATPAINLFEQRAWWLVIIYMAYGILTLCLMGFIIGEWS